MASLLALAVVAGCTTTSKGDPLPIPSTEKTASDSAPPSSDNGDEELPFAGAPKVENPLDTSRYERDPCRSLTADQAESLNLPRVGTIDDKIPLSIGCVWLNEETRGKVRIVFIVDDPRGLSPEYDANNRGEYELFEELPDIEGYPAIVRGIDDRAKGNCVVIVGVADDMAFATELSLSTANVGQKDPCKTASDIAGMALQTMKGA
ncbi:DUF3558 domain-containing protein [Actinophytocola oryzae]|uniref:DUF3558 domain-containing protein n=1 Tax=Actinophytocola oryzae TaxID=502181 RepID=UPI001415292D|nr:DUF3558 domain-containing protein [Actinophytocola oryzae]